MAFELKQSMKLVQQLVMTPQLQQAIKLLQLSRLELTNLVDQELQENPLLEESSLEPLDKSRVEKEEGPQRNEDPEEVKGCLEGMKDINWDEYMQNYEYYPRPIQTQEDPGRSLEATLSKKSSLVDHLRWQLKLSHFSKEEEAAAEMIIGNLNEDGYIDCSLEEIAAVCQYDVPFFEKVLALVHEFDPIGVAARNLQ